MKIKNQNHGEPTLCEPALRDDLSSTANTNDCVPTRHQGKPKQKTETRPAPTATPQNQEKSSFASEERNGVSQRRNPSPSRTPSSVWSPDGMGPQSSSSSSSSTSSSSTSNSSSTSSTERSGTVPMP